MVTKFIYHVARGMLNERFLTLPIITPQGGYSVYGAAPQLYGILQDVGPFSRLLPHAQAKRPRSGIKDTLRPPLAYIILKIKCP